MLPAPPTAPALVATAAAGAGWQPAAPPRPRLLAALRVARRPLAIRPALALPRTLLALALPNLLVRLLGLPPLLPYVPSAGAPLLVLLRLLWLLRVRGRVLRWAAAGRGRGARGRLLCVLRPQGPVAVPLRDRRPTRLRMVEQWRGRGRARPLAVVDWQPGRERLLCRLVLRVHRRAAVLRRLQTRRRLLQLLWLLWRGSWVGLLLQCWHGGQRQLLRLMLLLGWRRRAWRQRPCRCKSRLQLQPLPIRRAQPAHVAQRWRPSVGIEPAFAISPARVTGMQVVQLVCGAQRVLHTALGLGPPRSPLQEGVAQLGELGRALRHVTPQPLQPLRLLRQPRLPAGPTRGARLLGRACPPPGEIPQANSCSSCAAATASPRHASTCCARLTAAGGLPPALLARATAAPAAAPRPAPAQACSRVVGGGWCWMLRSLCVWHPEQHALALQSSPAGDALLQLSPQAVQVGVRHVCGYGWPPARLTSDTTLFVGIPASHGGQRGWQTTHAEGAAHAAFAVCQESPQ